MSSAGGKMFREAEAILAELGVSLDVRSPARGLTLAAQQSVEIAKAISLKVRVLIMDEPTASLSAHEVDQLFKLVRDLRDQGVAILFVSHRMEEVFEIADKVTVFRDGRLISTHPSRRGDARSRRSPTWSGVRWACCRRASRRRGASCCCRCAISGERASSRTSVRPASGRGAGLCRPDRRRPHRCRAGAVRHRAGDRGRSSSTASRSRSQLAPAGDGPAASPMSRKTGASSACRCRCRSRPTSRCRCSGATSTGSVSCANRMERATAEAFRERLAIRTPVGRSAGRQALRRQPAEGHAEQVAQHAAVGADPRRADARHRRRRQGRGPRDDRANSPPRASASS